jgi:hypothetical protein
MKPIAVRHGTPCPQGTQELRELALTGTREDHVPDTWGVGVLWTRKRHPVDALDGLLERGKDPRSKTLSYGRLLDVAVVPDRLSKIVTRLRENSNRHASEVEVAAKIDLVQRQHRDISRVQTRRTSSDDGVAIGDLSCRRDAAWMASIKTATRHAPIQRPPQRIAAREDSPLRPCFGG